MSLLAVWWWLRSPNYNNNNNFQNVNTDGNNNNNNANYCAGVRPGFCKYTRSNVVTEGKRLFRWKTTDVKGAALPWVRIPKTALRCPYTDAACMVRNVPNLISCVRTTHFRRHPTRHLYGGRIFWHYDKPRTAWSKVPAPQSKAVGTETGPVW